MAALHGIGFCFNKYRVTNSPLSLGSVSIALQKESLDTYQASVRELRDKKRGEEGRGGGRGKGKERNGKSRIGEPGRRRQSRNQFALFV